MKLGLFSAIGALLAMAAIVGGMLNLKSGGLIFLILGGLILLGLGMIGYGVVTTNRRRG